jgi:CheY-like chemotaxis protein
VLEHLKEAPDLRRIPVLMLTSSDSVADVLTAYDNHANAYIRKPTEIAQYFEVLAAVKQFWLGIVELPPLQGR